ncbi:hypothetical protein K1T71_013776 [Dendrolimus kikuchii]|uniref:Uncharacterized protein n=1 Tax=Dendrolimus kikuchii TaxID=765133 RepID=A0ACC1CFM7_9NEOP|nr:hypothetical protein K1T71_013776 [Dendrolimus kikuchii]
MAIVYVILIYTVLIIILVPDTYTNQNGAKLAENLRRQLMRDNYDYEPLSDSNLFMKYGDLDGQDQIKTFADELNMRAVDSKEAELNNDAGASHGIFKNDLLYYMDDDRLKTKMDLETTTAKYKVLKLKPAHPNRRSNSQRRLIQEESPDGITILTLDDDPLPPFQLPKTRRQYMQHHGAMDTEEELVPGVDE